MVPAQDMMWLSDARLDAQLYMRILSAARA